MIQVAQYARDIQRFLQKKTEDGIISKFKIFVRINFQLDVYIFSDALVTSDDYFEEFIQWIKPSKESQEESFIRNLKISFFVVSSGEAEDPFYAQIADGDEEINWGPRYRFDSFLNSDTENHTVSEKVGVPVVTFYSYKGGMGRTTTMIAYAVNLAVKCDKTVVVIDCDLEAPGYLNFFDLSEHKELNEGKKNGLVEFFCDSQFGCKNLDINDYVVNVGALNKNKFAYENLDKVWMVPAGNLNEGCTEESFDGQDRNDYLEALAKLNLANKNILIRNFNELIKKIDESIKPDVILIDSRTGFNDIFGTTALQLSDCVVGFFGKSRQTEPGFIKLLTEYNKSEKKFALQLVYSILADEDNEGATPRMKDILSRFCEELPSQINLHRKRILERIGTDYEKANQDFLDMVVSDDIVKQFADYKQLFENIDEKIFPQNSRLLQERQCLEETSGRVEMKAEEREDGCEVINKNENVPSVKNSISISKNTPAIVLRNIILKHLKSALVNVTNFAEDSTIKESQFFYRNCMNELFLKEKFLIQGYKGTGKTYLYRALTDNQISKNLQIRSGYEGSEEIEFLNILPKDDSEASYPFKTIQYSKIEEPEYYFNCFWQIYTWNKALLDDENVALNAIRKEVREASALKDFILPISGNDTKIRYNELIENEYTLTHIEKDMNLLNEKLRANNKMLVILYDRLDTCINPLRWNKAVSPLIEYWRSNHSSFSNIMPKVFVRTDLFRQIEGTNTARLFSNIINIEWSIGEVFGYFFKLIFTDELASQAYWCIAEKLSLDFQYIASIKKTFAENSNQFKSLNSAEMNPIVQIFFGKEVRVGAARLGRPWDYFEKELANADRSAISLRPFINTMDRNAVDKALAKTEAFVHEIISSEIYASKSVRDDTTEKYFNDLARDAFSKDLFKFKEVIRTAGGENFRYKSLDEHKFEELMSKTFVRIGDESAVIKGVNDLKNLIFANGIMAEHITTKGRYYRFAPIYWYAWGLSNSEIDVDVKKSIKKQFSSPAEMFPQGEKFVGTVKMDSLKHFYISVPSDDKEIKFSIKDRISDSIKIGDIVKFTAGHAPHSKKFGIFLFAYDIHKVVPKKVKSESYIQEENHSKNGFLKFLETYF